MQSEGITPPAKPNSFMLRRTLSYIRDAPVQARSGREVHYHILQAASATDKGNQQIVTKIRKDFRCHLCGFNALWEAGIVLHCCTHHGHDYSVKYVNSPNGVLNLAFQPIRYPPEPKRRKGASTKGLFTPLHLHWHHWSASPGKSDVYHPVRQYLHMGSLEKMLIGEWMLHLDDSCEQVEDSDWLRKLDRAYLDEFTDVSVQEKYFFGLWNDFAQSDLQIPIDKVPGLCRDFIQIHAIKLDDSGLEEQLIWHLTSLWDEGILSRTDLLTCMVDYSDLLGQSKAQPVPMDLT